MEFVNSVMGNNRMGGSGNPFSFMKNISKPLTAPQRDYLSKTFSVLAIGAISSAVGAYWSMFYFQIPLFLSFIGQLVCVMYISSTSYSSYKVIEYPRIGCFVGMSFLNGGSLGPLLTVISDVNPSIIPQALLATAAVFICFVMAAAYAKQRKYMFLGSALGSMMLYMTILSFANMFLRINAINNVIVYGGLVVYIGYVVYHTQKTVDAYDRGQRDYVMHAIRFYLDMVGIFVRIAIILTQRETKRQEDENKKRRW